MLSIMDCLSITAVLKCYMPSCFRIISPSQTYSAKHSGFRNVAGLIEATGAPLITFLIGTVGSCGKLQTSRTRRERGGYTAKGGSREAQEDGRRVSSGYAEGIQ